MITRFEVDGFKNLRNFSCDFGPYTCIAGPNSVGKSNVFDALGFLSATATTSFHTAAAAIRGEGGDLDDLFAPGCDRIRMAAELVVPAEFYDDFKRLVEVNHTYLRYELTLAKQDLSVATGGAVTAISLVEERLVPLSRQYAEERLGWVDFNGEFKKTALRFSRKSKPLIETITEPPAKVIVYAGTSTGRPPEVPLPEGQTVGTSALSGFGGAEYPFQAAMKYEMRRWLTLSLEPSAMRAPSDATAPDQVSAEGGNLPKTLSRLMRTVPRSDVLGALTESVRDLVDIRKIDVDFDNSRQLFTLRAQVGSAPMLAARSLSDGTLRFLALSILYMDPEFSGLICFEEPENGIHPRKMEQMYRLMRDLAADPKEAIGPQNPLRQVIVNTHSPAYIYQHADAPDNLMIASHRPGTHELALSPVRTAASWRKHEDGQVPPDMVTELMEESFPGTDFDWWNETAEETA
ncbi:ATP-binding protein [Corynebacterium timonense]|uniref:Predicted ATPase n=1 Tax=Corynebacterium timonense TaxID=441500 RepID=A0A1H1VJL9_9CORY|nr:ATP-binding protein [Corynebacterium timonense]SDS84982.1 Predicted ATPase [Corynebacterium timonense]